MPEANVLYSVTVAVIVGLVAWVAFVLKTAKEPWARAPAGSMRTVEVGGGEAKADADEKADAEADAEADAKAKAEADADAKADEVAGAKGEEAAK